MATSKVYRTFLIAGFSTAALLFTACGGPTKTHTTMKQDQYKRFNLAKLAVTYQLATQQYAVGDYKKCRKTIEEALSMREPHAGLEMLAAKVDIESGSLETAASHLKQSIIIEPKDPEPYYLLGVVFQRWQKMETAEEYYQQAWDRKAGEARYMLAVVEMKITSGQLEQAQQLLEDKMAFFEQTAAVRVALARIASLKQDYLGASKHYREAYLLASEDENVKRSYAESLFFAGKYSDAIPLLEGIRSQLKQREDESPDRVESERTSLTLLLGQAYLNLHRTFEARTCFQEVTQNHPNNLQAILGLGKVCVETGDYPVAISAGRRVLRSDPKNVQAMILIAMVQQKQKKWSESLATLQGAAIIAPKDSTVLCMQGLCTLKLGENEEAIKYFELAVAANPRDAWAVDLLVRMKPSITTPTPAPRLNPDESVPDAVTTMMPAKNTEAP